MMPDASGDRVFTQNGPITLEVFRKDLTSLG